MRQLLKAWQEAHGPLTEAQQDSFRARPEAQTLARGLPSLAAAAVTRHRRLVDALAWYAEQVAARPVRQHRLRRGGHNPPPTGGVSNSW
jgi:hypothetical protein